MYFIPILTFSLNRLVSSKPQSQEQQYREAGELTDDRTLCLADFFRYKCRSKLSSLGTVVEIYARPYALNALISIALVSKALNVLEHFGIYMDAFAFY